MYYSNDVSAELIEVLEILAPVFGFLAFIWLVAIVVSIVSYVLKGLGILNMSKARGLSNGWLGFIPYARNYQLGKVAGEIELGDKKITNMGLWMLLAPILYTAVFVIGYLIVFVPYFISIFTMAEHASPDAITGPITYLMIATTVFVLVLLFVQALYFLIWYLGIHKIFSRYATGQKPVFYLILAMFVPLAYPILLFMLSKRPMLAEEAPIAPAPMAPPPVVAAPAAAVAPVVEAPVQVVDAVVEDVVLED